MTIYDGAKSIFQSGVPYIGAVGAFFSWMAENGAGVVTVITIILMIWRFALERKGILLKNKRLEQGDD